MLALSKAPGRRTSDMRAIHQAFPPLRPKIRANQVLRESPFLPQTVRKFSFRMALY